MDILLNFHIQNLPPCDNQIIREEFPFSLSFGEILQKILGKYCPSLTLGHIAVLTDKHYIFTFDDLHQTLGEIMGIHLTTYTLTARDAVNGPNLLGSSLEMAKMKKESEEIFDTLSSTMLSDTGDEGSGEVEGDISPPTPASIPLPKIVSKPASRSATMGQPEGPPKSPPSAPLEELSFEESSPLPPTSPPPPPSSRSSTSEPKLEFESELAPLPSLEPVIHEKEKAKKRDIGSEHFRKGHSKKKAMLRKEKAILADDEFDLDEESEVPEMVSETPVVVSDGPRTFHKNIAVDYFNVMNPEKYYPLVLNVADIEQATRWDQENLITGERKTQTKDAMDVELMDPIVTVRPIFPGCNVTPESIQTDFDHSEDEITFYITPLVNDDLDECRIDFVNSENHVVHTIPTPSKVQDPRYARTVALYGTLASVIPKLFLLFGIDIGTDVSADQILPWLEFLVGGMTLSNIIGIFGICVALIISGFVYFSRKPKSVLRRYKLQDLRRKVKIRR